MHQYDGTQLAGKHPEGDGHSEVSGGTVSTPCVTQLSRCQLLEGNDKNVLE